MIRETRTAAALSTAAAIAAFLAACFAHSAPAGASATKPGDPFAGGIRPGPVALSCADSGRGAGRVRVSVQVAYADLRPALAPRSSRRVGRGTARLVLRTPAGKVLARTGSQRHIPFGATRNHVYITHQALLGKRASGRVLRYAHGRPGCRGGAARDRRVALQTSAFEAIRRGAKEGLRARLQGSTRVVVLPDASNTSCPPYSCFKEGKDVLAWSEADVRQVDKATVPLASRLPASGPKMLVGLDNGPWSYWSDSDLNSQGSARSGNVFNFSHWQYVDTLYYYAHQLLAVPPTVWVNAAHRNGVSVLGTMTGDCTTCGAEMNKLFEESREEAVDRLYRLAKAYGFDGWIIDVEGEARYTAGLERAMAELRERGLQVATYEAFKYSLAQGMLKPFEAAGSWQADYSSDTSYSKKTFDFLIAKGFDEGRRYDTYWATYVYRPYGENGPAACGRRSSAQWVWNGFACNNAEALFANQAAARAGGALGFYQSLALFAPGWTFFGGRNAPPDPPAPREVTQAAEERFWAGSGGYRLGAGGCALTTSPQSSVSSFIAPRSTLTEIPFSTRFDGGEGDWFTVNGKVVGRNWNLLAAQDAMPSAICGEDPQPQAGIEYGNSFDGGSSLHVSGTVDPSRGRISLYEASAKLPARPGFVLRYETARRGPPPHVVAWIDNGGPIDLDMGTPVREGSWTYAQATLPAKVAAGTLTRLGIGFDTLSPETVDVRIGELAVVDLDDYSPPALIAPKLEASGELTWSDPSSSTMHYNVWAVASGEACTRFIGRAFLPRYDLTRPLFAVPDRVARFLVQPVSAAGRAAELSPPPC